MEKIKKRKSLYRIISSIVDALVFPIIFLSLCVSSIMLISKQDRAITPIFGHAIVRVLSNSMSTYCEEAQRSFFKGDIAILEEKQSYNVGDVIAFYDFKDTVDDYSKLMKLTTYSSQEVYEKDKNGNIIYENGEPKKITNNYVADKDENGNVIFNNDLLRHIQNTEVGNVIAGTTYRKTTVPKNRTSRDKVDASKTRVIFHQIIQIKVDTNGTIFYATKGTHNGSPDTFEVRSDMVFGCYAKTSRWLSDFLGFCASSTGLIVLVIVPISIVILFESLSILEQINNIILERNVIARASLFDTKECEKAKIGSEMSYFNKIYLYDVMSNNYKNDLYKIIWGYYKNSDKKKDKDLYETSQLAVAKYQEGNTQKYYDIWLDFYNSKRKQQKILDAQKRAEQDRYQDVLIEEYQNYRPRKKTPKVNNQTVEKQPKSASEQQADKILERIKNIENAKTNLEKDKK